MTYSAKNLFGLELDPRCTQIAAFALALQAWKTSSYRHLPIPNIACSGISAKGRLEDWKKLAQGDERLERSLERLHALLSDAGDLGSLIDPLREADGELLVARFAEASPLLAQALERETAGDPSAAIFGSAVAGAARAASFLARQYTLVTTNPPFLGQLKQSERLKHFCIDAFPRGQRDLATSFIERNESLAGHSGTVAMVTPQNWFFLKSYAGLRIHLLEGTTLDLVALIGEHGFRSSQAAGAFTALTVFSVAPRDAEHRVLALDLDEGRNPEEKSVGLASSRISLIEQQRYLENPDSRITFEVLEDHPALREFVTDHQGLSTGDNPRFRRRHWEVPRFGDVWEGEQSSVEETTGYGGRTGIIMWDKGTGALASFGRENVKTLHNVDRRGEEAWGRRGVAVSQMRGLPVTLYCGEKFDTNVAVLLPKDPADLPALWAFCVSGALLRAVRMIDRKLNVTNSTFTQVPFDAAHWSRVAADEHPYGLPAVESSDPTQWLFDGHPRQATAPLQVGVARLAGYRWARQTGTECRDCPALAADGLESFADEDGIVCIPSIRGERPASERLRALLAAAFGGGWSPTKETDLLSRTGYAGKSLEQWLRDDFFQQHCQLFHQRPFVWQVWDGRKDGFSALINYHRFERANLEKLIYTYLGDWIRLHREAAAAGTAGADVRLAAAQQLQRKLELILEGEAPYDIFVRWKPLEEQPLGWEPDMKDGTRLNIRPFVAAGVLRKNPKITWGKDRGKDPESAPWYSVFKGDRVNDHHLTLAEKRAVREAAARRVAAS